MLCGQLAYVLVFRRPLMSLLFHIYRQSSPDGSRHTPIKIHLWARNELLTISFLLPMSIGYLKAGADETLYAADASLTAAGGCGFRVGKAVITELWRRISMKVRTLGLLDPISAELRLAGYEIEEEEEMSDAESTCAVKEDDDVPDEVIEADKEFDRRALIAMGDPKGDIGVCCFAVMEVCGGVGGISKYASAFGLRTGPVLELKKGWDLFEGGLFMWLFRMCLAGRIWLLVLEPPCTTFSIARCPKLRSILEAEGFNGVEFETLQGNLFCIMCTLLALAQWAAGNDALFEQPASGFMQYTSWWLLLRCLGFDALVTPFCGYLPRDGIVYQKLTIFAFLKSYWHEIYRPCTCTVPHTRLEGSLTTTASAYPDRLCRLIARIAAREFPGGSGPWGRGFAHDDVVGEDVGNGDLRASGTGLQKRRIKGSELFSVILSECLPWRVLLKHPFKRHGHINIQEARAYQSLLRRMPPCSRVCVMQDSQVNLAVEAKGRSSSLALNRVYGQTAMELVGRELYPKCFHTPTWSLRADDPSRDRRISRPRLRWPGWLFGLLSADVVRQEKAREALDSLPLLSKSELRWMCLVLGAADAVDMVLGAGGGAEAAEEGREAPGAHSGRARWPADLSTEDPAGGGVCGVRGRRDRRGPDFGSGAHRSSGPLRLDAGSWLQSLRQQSAGWRLERHDSGTDGRLRLCTSGYERGVADRQDLGALGTGHRPSTSTLRDLPRDACYSSGVGMGADSDDIAHCLFLLVAAGRDIRHEALGRLDDANRRGGRAPRQDRSIQKLVKGVKKPVRETGRMFRLRVLEPLSEEYASYRSLMAGLTVGVRASISEALGGCPADAASIHRRLLEDRRSNNVV